MGDFSIAWAARVNLTGGRRGSGLALRQSVLQDLSVAWPRAGRGLSVPQRSEKRMLFMSPDLGGQVEPCHTEGQR
jgi:hypothetical protein